MRLDLKQIFAGHPVVIEDGHPCDFIYGLVKACSNISRSMKGGIPLPSPTRNVDPFFWDPQKGWKKLWNSRRQSAKRLNLGRHDDQQSARFILIVLKILILP